MDREPNVKMQVFLILKKTTKNKNKTNKKTNNKQTNFSLGFNFANWLQVDFSRGLDFTNLANIHENRRNLSPKQFLSLK